MYLESSKQTPLVDIIGEIVDGMRETNTITSFNELSTGYYELTVDNSLGVNEVVTIGGIDYLVVDSTSTSFNINANTGLDFTGEVFKAKAPYYLYGHPLEIVNTLTQLNKSAIYSYQKYPLIALFQDFEESYLSENATSYSCSPTFIIANLTKSDIKASDRYDRNFRDVLYPLKEMFITELEDSGRFNYDGRIEHSKIDRLYWGTEAANGNDGNIANDYLDAIQINNTELNVISKNC